MEIVLLLIAGVVIYFLYNTLQDYLKNPIQTQQQPYSNSADTAPIDFENPYEEMAQTDRLKSNEFSVLAAILGYLVWSDKKVCPLEEQLLAQMLADMAAESKNPKFSKEELKDILMKQESPSISLEELCDSYVQLTKGEYKKRLKVVEFLFVLAYADGVLEESEKDCIIDIAALFEIANEDFNALFEQFEQEYAKANELSQEQAKAVFGISEISGQNELTQMYNELIKSTKQNIFDSKNINKTFRDTSLERIREIDNAYKVLLELANKEQQNAQDRQNTQDSKEEKKPDSGWNF
ncbi:tellurite resistance TerB family protein [Helicobacter marmotae]|uniref:Molecular chaperone DnaJ n=1 Tax=Helicobacter marmotae TaxID=152490 RepID=A0A3D8I4B5_9HELI|nr:TerB family tellurite resistance protein [Helicobacter marmotae]RDU60000.1 molecular chaperone DnaJ [Helicobacter marmotae]